MDSSADMLYNCGMRTMNAFALSLLGICAAARGGVREQFANPPDDCRLQAWYHWTTTGITDECLAADMKAMGELGVGTAHVFMPSQQGVPPNTQPLSPEWWKRWETFLREAKKNNVKVGFHNCPGWSSSGGVWIKPEDSMKVLVSAAADVPAGAEKVRLPQPRIQRDFYRDVAVFALPVAASASPAKVSGDFKADFAAFRAGAAALELPTSKDDPKSCEVVLEYAEPIAPTTLVTTWEESKFWLDLRVMASADGADWKEVGSRSYRLFNAQLTPKVLPLASCPPSRFFKLSFSTVQPPPWVGFRRRRLSAVEFTSAPLVADIDDRNGASTAFGFRAPDAPAAAGVAKDAIADVTRWMAADGTFDWAAARSATPRLAKGAWRLLRVGYTTTGKCCAPAPGNVRGLECDKLTKKGLDAHWPHMPHKMINAPGGAGTVAVSIVDSWEVGGQNWTETFPQEFAKRRGYDIRPWLPAMAGYVVGTQLETAKFLYDVQRTVSDLMCENYYDYFAERCHAEGVKSATESYGGPFDSLRAFKAADVPTGEFWLGREAHGSPRIASSAGHLYGRAQIGAEAFTTEAKEGRWQITPHEFRVNGDRGWFDGVSQLVYHSYLQQPFMNVKPGFSLDRHGTQFNRHTTWWPEGKWWAKYVQRGQLILQRGEPKADVLVFAGDGHPNGYVYQRDAVADGFNFDYCGADDLKRLVARDGGVAMPGRLPYSVLWLGTDRHLRLETVRAIHALVKSGARVAGLRPVDTPSLGDDAAAWRAEVEAVWGGGHANLKEANSARQALRAFGVRAPMEASAGALVASRRVIDGRDFYFVLNGSQEEFDGAVSFAAKGRPERWDAKTGRIEPLPWYADEAGRVKTRLALHGEESAFVSFREPAAGESPKSAWDGPTVEYAAVEILSARYEARDDAAAGLDVTANLRKVLADGTREFKVGNATLGVRDPASNRYKVMKVKWTADGEARETVFNEHSTASFKVVRKTAKPQPKVLLDLSRDWTATSFTGKNAPAAPRPFPALAGWNESSDERLRYFAGRAVYEKTSPGLGSAAAGRSVALDLGDVRELVNVWVNGRFLGCLWEAPYRVELPADICAAETLSIRLEVVNTWPNRLIGDAKARKGGAAEPRGAHGLPQWVLDDRPDSGTGIYTWMNWMKGWTADDEPRPAGLLGPVRLIETR